MNEVMPGFIPGIRNVAARRQFRAAALPWRLPQRDAMYDKRTFRAAMRNSLADFGMRDDGFRE